jgi:hypothetical protein
VAPASEIGAAAPGGGHVEAKGKQPKVKPLSPRDILANKITELGAGEKIMYKLPVVYGGDLAVIELNPQHPKGHKYLLSTETMVDGKPTGKRRALWDSDKPRDMASWIVERNGEIYS